MNRQRRNKILSVLLVFCYLFTYIVPSGLSTMAQATEATATYSYHDLSDLAVAYINDQYMNGTPIDGYTAYVLTQAGEDLDSAKWSKDGVSLADRLRMEAELLGNDRTLLSYIVGTQNEDGSFGPFANAYGSRIALQALGMLPAEVKTEATVEQAVYDGIDYFKSLGYATGAAEYKANNGEIDYRAIEALTAVGEDLTVGEWVYNGTSLAQQVRESAQAAILKADQLGAEVLAKELAALAAVDTDAPELAALATAITAQAKDDGNGGSYFGSSIYDDVVVLTALGRTGYLSGVDQAKALNYLKSFAIAQQDIWKTPKGKAWWGWDNTSVETDLTAQVITSLSFFADAQQADSEVAGLIKDGLTYLQYQQNSDNAGIKDPEDQTSATAEGLIALQSVGVAYNSSGWVRDSGTKTLARTLMGLTGIGDSTAVNRIASLLVDRQKPVDSLGAGSFENSVYSDMWAFIALAKADKLASLDRDLAIEYILSKQASAAEGSMNAGSWGETFDMYYPDFLSTVQAIEALTFLKGATVSAEVQAAIDAGISYLRTFQQDDGGVYNAWDDPAVDNAEIIVLLNALNIEADNSQWTKVVAGQRVNPASYLATGSYNADSGTFGSMKNIEGATQVLYASDLLQDKDLAYTVNQGTIYLQNQFKADNSNYLYKEYLGYRAAITLKAAGEDITSAGWTQDGASLASMLIDKAKNTTAADDSVELAKTLILLCGVPGENLSAERARLVSLLADKQLETGNFSTGIIYDEIIPYLALTIADGWGQLSVDEQTRAKAWLINAQTQTEPNKGSWQHAYGTDTMSTAQAIYVLAHFADSKTQDSPTMAAIDAGLQWLKTKQGNQGQVVDGWDVAVVDTAETALAVLATGGNPDGLEWSTNGQSLIDFLLLSENIKSDGSNIEPSADAGNVGSTLTVMQALLEYNSKFGWIDFADMAVVDPDDEPTNPGTPSTEDDAINVDIAVVDKDWKPLYGPKENLKINKDDQYGLTALGALAATNLDFELGYSGSKVESIDDIVNSGLNGWMFKVNGRVPATAAIDYDLEDGDQVIWWYSTDYNSDGPTWEQLQNKASAPSTSETSKIELTKQVRDELSKLADQLGTKTPADAATKAVTVINSERKAFLERKALKAELTKNEVKLTQRVKKSEDAEVTDALGEVSLQIPANSLSADKSITVTEKAIDQAKLPTGLKSLTSTYSMEPDTLDLKNKVIVQIKVPISALIKPENVILARYDDKSKQWLCVPAVVDASKNVIMTETDTLGEFTVFGKEELKGFTDVEPEAYKWADTSIQTLAGAGIITGVTETRFEPKRAVTRAELVSLLVRALALPKAETAGFKDVQSKDWFIDEVAAAKKAGLINGYEDGSFRPQQLITREEMAVIMAKALELKQQTAEPLSFKDKSSISGWAQQGVASIAAKGLINGFPDGKFQPKEKASRAQCAVVIHKLLAME